MQKVIATDDKQETTEEKEPKQTNKPIKKADIGKKEQKEEHKTGETKLTPKNYFKENTNFKFEAYINDTPIKEMTIREPGKYGLVRFKHI